MHISEIRFGQKKQKKEKKNSHKPAEPQSPLALLEYIKLHGQPPASHLKTAKDGAAV